MKKLRFDFPLTAVTLIAYGVMTRVSAEATTAEARFVFGVLTALCFAKVMLSLGRAGLSGTGRREYLLAVAAAVFFGPLLVLSAAVRTAVGWSYAFAVLAGLSLLMVARFLARFRPDRPG